MLEEDVEAGEELGQPLAVDTAVVDGHVHSDLAEVEHGVGAEAVAPVLHVRVLAPALAFDSDAQPGNDSVVTLTEPVAGAARELNLDVGPGPHVTPLGHEPHGQAGIVGAVAPVREDLEL